MPIIIEKIDMPSECHGCIFEDRVGGCIILNKTGACGKSYEEYDDEWFKAHNEHRRLKWCPLKEFHAVDEKMAKEIKQTIEKNQSVHWIVDGDIRKCPECGKEQVIELPFCPWCGTFIDLLL